MGGCVGMVVPLGNCTRGTPWLKEVLGCCLEPEDLWAIWEGPEEVVDSWARCWPRV